MYSVGVHVCVCVCVSVCGIFLPYPNAHRQQTDVHKLAVVNFKAYGRVVEATKTQAAKLDKWPQLIR